MYAALVSAPIWVVSPVFHDVESFLILRERVLGVLAGNPGVGEIGFLVIDDTAGADPEIGELVRRGVRVLEPPFNLGHQRAIVLAVRTLMRELPDDAVIVTMDADGEDQPEDLPSLLAALDSIDDGRGVVLARRAKRREPVLFKTAYLMFRILFRSLTGTTIKTGNYAVYRSGQARRLFTHPAFDLSYSSAILSLDVPRAYVDCDRGRRLAGESKMGYTKLAEHGLRMLMPFVDRIATRALAVFAGAFAGAGIFALTILILRIVVLSAVPMWAVVVLVATAIVCLVSFGSFVTLFAVFSQSRAVSLSGLEDKTWEREPV